MKKLIIFLILCILVSINLISSEDFGYNFLEQGENLNPALNCTGGGGGGNLTCADCDDRFVNVDGDSMTGDLSIIDMLTLIQLDSGVGYPILKLINDYGQSNITYEAGNLVFIGQDDATFYSNLFSFGDLTVGNDGIQENNLTVIGDANITNNLFTEGVVIYYE